LEFGLLFQRKLQRQFRASHARKDGTVSFD
jgi:hypothetical protein